MLTLLGYLRPGGPWSTSQKRKYATIGVGYLSMSVDSTFSLTCSPRGVGAEFSHSSLGFLVATSIGISRPVLQYRPIS